MHGGAGRALSADFLLRHLYAIGVRNCAWDAARVLVLRALMRRCAAGAFWGLGGTGRGMLLLLGAVC